MSFPDSDDEPCSYVELCQIALLVIRKRSRSEEIEREGLRQASVVCRHGISRRPDTDVLRAEMHARTFGAIDRLLPVFREAILMHEVEGLVFREIAEFTEVPIGTVGSRVFRGKANLRLTLSDML